MSAVWTDANKFKKWLAVELAVLKVREQRGELPPGTTEGIKQKCYVDSFIETGVNTREKEIGHDLNAFVELMRMQVIQHPPDDQERALYSIVRDEWVTKVLAKGHPEKWDHYFHEGMTSYDTEEPAMALLIGEADQVLDSVLGRVDEALCQLARKYRGTVMIGRTHGQFAQPVTFGKRCLDWLGPFRAAREAFEQSSERVAVMKLSGAVGMYGMLDPEIEAEVAQELDLTVTAVATQIVPLGLKAHHLSTLALIAAEVEKIAHDLWLLNQSEIGEVAEPFGKKQKGSSAMPHKKNPITLEKLFGLPRLMAGYAAALQHGVATAHERDISHSSVERIAVPDAYGLLDHMLRKLAWVLEGLQVFPERMQKNLDAAGGVYASQALRELLGQEGIPGETAYRFVQTCSFKAKEMQLPFAHVFLDLDDEDVPKELRNRVVNTMAFKQALDPKWWVRHEGVYYDRLGI